MDTTKSTSKKQPLALISGISAITSQLTGFLFFENVKMERQRTNLPYKQIIPKFDLKFLIDKSNRSRAKKVIKKMLDIAVNGGIISTVAQVNESNLQRIYDYAYPILIELLYPGSEVTRAHDINVNTLANRLKT